MTTAKSAARAVQDSTAFRVIARIGYVVLGIVHIVIGAIAVTIASGGSGNADQSGAMAQIRQVPLGIALVWAIAIGLAALAAWQIAEAIVEQDPDTKKKWGRRVKFVGTALAYLAIAGTALVAALGGRSDSEQSSQSFSAQLMVTPGGVALLVAIGLVILAIGVAFVVRGFTRGFEKNLDLRDNVAHKGIVIFGVVGYVAKGVAVATTGALFLYAAFAHNPEAAGGLDGALHTLASLPFGAFILWVIGAGLALYGVFCVARARYAKL